MGLHFVMPKSAKADLADPASWIDAAHGQIEAEQLAVGGLLEDAIKANNDNRAGFFRDVDIVAVVHAGLTFNGQPMRTLDTTPIPTAEDFEKTIWKGWLEGYHGVPDINDADAWLVIMHRIDDLDEDGWDFVMKYLAEGDKLQRAKKRPE
jgi:NAD(P)-dependent dehydrogenase (short-subunit alcohol dehydrogenase family)